MRAWLVGLSPFALIATMAPASADMITESQLAGHSICWDDHGKAKFHRNHSYDYISHNEGHSAHGSWSISGGTVTTRHDDGGGNSFSIDLNGSKVQASSGWSGKLCGGD